MFHVKDRKGGTGKEVGNPPGKRDVRLPTLSFLVVNKSGRERMQSATFELLGGAPFYGEEGG